MIIVGFAFILACFAFAIFFSIFLFSDFRREHEFVTNHIVCGILVAITITIGIASATITVLWLLFPLAIWEIIVTIIQIKDSYNPYMRKKYLLEQIKDLQNKLSKSHEEERKLMCEIDNLQAENEELRKKLRERPPITSKEYVRDEYDSKINQLKFDLNKSKSSVAEYQKALEFCVIKHPELANELPAFDDPHFHKKNRTFTEVIKERSDELSALNQRIADGQTHLSQLILFHKNSSRMSRAIRQTFRNEYKINKFFDSITSNRLNYAFESKLLISNLRFSADIYSGAKKYENTSLTHCSCEDFIFQKGPDKLPCKHILFLAYSLGLLQFNEAECNSYTKDTVERLSELYRDKVELDKRIENEKDSLSKICAKEKAHQQSLDNLNTYVEKMIEEKCAAYPYLAGTVSDLKTLYYVQASKYLRKKARPAIKEARRIDELRRETNQIHEQKSVLEYKLNYIHIKYPETKQLFEDSKLDTSSDEYEFKDTEQLRVSTHLLGQTNVTEDKCKPNELITV